LAAVNVIIAAFCGLIADIAVLLLICRPYAVFPGKIRWASAVVSV